MDIGKSISFVFEDKKWIEKILIGGLIMMLTVIFSWTIIVGVIGGALMLGYMVKLVRNVRERQEYPLPAWDEWGEKIVSGIKLMVIFFVWSLPLIIISFPFGILTGLAGEDLGGLLALCFSCISILYAIILFLASPAITIRFAEGEDLSSGFQFSEILEFTKNHVGDIIIAVIVLWLIQMVAGFIGLLLCGVGMFFTGIWAMMVQGHLYGQIGLDDADVSGDDYELSPGDVMPGVGELTDSVQDGADKATDAIADTSDSVAEAAGDVADATTDAGDAVDSAADTVSDAVDKATDSD